MIGLLILFQLVCIAVTVFSVDVPVTTTTNLAMNTITSSTLNIYPQGKTPNSSWTVTCSGTTTIDQNGVVSIYGLSVDTCSSVSNFKVLKNGALTFDNIWISSKGFQKPLVSCEGNGKIVLSNSYVNGNTFTDKWIELKDNCTLEILNSEVKTNNFQIAISSIASQNAQISIQSSTVSDNSVTSFINLSSAAKTKVVLKNSTFESITATTQAVINTVDSTSNINLLVQDCKISFVKGKNAGFVYIEKAPSTISIESSTMNNITNSNTGSFGVFALVDVTSGSFSLNNCQGSYNNASLGTIMYFGNSTIPVQVSSSSFEGNVAFGSGSTMAILGKFNNQLTISNLTINRSPSVAYGSIYIAGTTTGFGINYLYINITANNIYFSNTEVKTGGLFALLYTYAWSFTINNSKFTGNYASTATSYGMIHAVTPLFENFSSKNCSFIGNYGKFTALGVSARNPQFFNFLIDGWEAKNNTFDSNGIIHSYYASNSTFNIINSNFERNVVAKGGAVIMIEGAKSDFYISNCTFMKNEPSASGEIEVFFANANIYLNDNRFESGTRLALNLQSINSLRLENNEFLNYNIANSVVKMTTVSLKAEFYRNKFVNNTAIPSNGVNNLFVADVTGGIFFSDNYVEKCSSIRYCVHLRNSVVSGTGNVFYDNQASYGVSFFDRTFGNYSNSQYFKTKGGSIFATATTSMDISSIYVEGSTNENAAVDVGSVIEVTVGTGNITFSNLTVISSTPSTGYLIRAAVTSSSAALTIRDSKFLYNNGYIMYSEGTMILSDNLFQRNIANSTIEKGVIEIGGSMNYFISGCQFIENEGNTVAPIIIATPTKNTFFSIFSRSRRIYEKQVPDSETTLKITLTTCSYITLMMKSWEL